DNGTYDVSLTVTASGGGSANVGPVQIIVRNVAPKAAQLTNDGPKTPGQNVHIELLGATDAPADVAAGLFYQFDTNGDGIYDSPWSTDAFVDVPFAAPGIYTVKGHVRDKDGGVSSDFLSDVWISLTGGGNGGVISTRLIAAGSEASQPNGFLTPASVI